MVCLSATHPCVEGPDLGCLGNAVVLVLQLSLQGPRQVDRVYSRQERTEVAPLIRSHAATGGRLGTQGVMDTCLPPKSLHGLPERASNGVGMPRTPSAAR